MLEVLAESMDVGSRDKESNFLERSVQTLHRLIEQTQLQIQIDYCHRLKCSITLRESISVRKQRESYNAEAM